MLPIHPHRVYTQNETSPCIWKFFCWNLHPVPQTNQNKNSTQTKWPNDKLENLQIKYHLNCPNLAKKRKAATKKKPEINLRNNQIVFSNGAQLAAGLRNCVDKNIKIKGVPGSVAAGDDDYSVLFSWLN
jgi:hypothetical protein